MARIFAFPKKNSEEYDENGADAASWTYKDRIRSHKLVIFYRALLVIILTAAIVFALVMQAKNRVYTSAEVAASADNHSIRTENMVDFAGTILSYGMDGAACVDVEGKALWNITYQMQEPMISVQGDMAAIGDYGSRTIYLLRTTGSIGEISTTMPIYKFSVSQSGEVAVILNDTDTTWIYLYDSLGNILAYFKTTMRQSGFPVDVAISPNGKIVGVSYIYVDSGDMRSRVSYYNFGDVGRNETDNYVSGYDYAGTVIPAIHFMDNEISFAVADDRLMFYRGAEKPVSYAEHLVSEEIQKVFFNDRYVALVFYSDQAEYRYHIEIFNKSGNLVDEREYNSEFKEIVMDNDLVYIYSESRVLEYRINGNTAYEGMLPKSAYLLIPGKNSGKFTTVNSDTVDTVQLR
ncbi:hypothetical protein SAMN02910292_01001 [Lachnospiraceae bacterium XBB2008]|nr:hypothetical protein SAMN02910292_01001 [Lachnospiraceae bacterium XBB2008]